MIVTGNQSPQENNNLCFVCLTRVFNNTIDDGIHFNPRSISIQSAVCHNLAKIVRVMLAVRRAARADSHNCVKHFLVGFHKTSDRI